MAIDTPERKTNHGKRRSATVSLRAQGGMGRV